MCRFCSHWTSLLVVREYASAMAPFQLNRDELQHDLPWRLMQSSPVTLYCRRDYFEEDESALHEALRLGLGLPHHTGHNFDALNDSLSDIEVPGESGVMVALDHVTDAPRADVLLQVLADASRWWLLFGRIFGVLARTDSPDYDAPLVGAMRPDWNRREGLSANRGT